MRAASTGCERPANTMSRFHGPRSIQCPGAGSLMTWLDSSPGRATSVALTLSMLVVDPPFFCFLPRCKPGQRSRGDIIRDDRTRCNPTVVSNVDRSKERIVDAGPDVAPDPGLALGEARLVREVGGDVAGCDVRVLADLGVADVGEVRDLRPRADGGRLHLDERPDLRALAHDRAGPDVRERADLDAGGDANRSAEDAEGMDGDVRLDHHARVDPRRRRVDDGDAGEPVLLVDPVAERLGREGELGARVDPLHLERVRRRVHRNDLAVADEEAERVGDVELALRVVRLQAIEHGPELRAAEDADARVHLT